MKNRLFTGSGVAIVTPFNEDGVDFEAFGRLIDYQVEHGTDAIIVCGTTGESATMPDYEHISVVEYCVKKVNKRVPVIAGTGSNDTAHCVELSKSCEAAGADGLLLVTPYYNKATQKGLIKHYTMIADSVNIPMILYNVPSRTGVNIGVNTLFELAKHENIVAIKEASGNISLTAEMAAKCLDKIDFYSGNDDCVTPIMALGGVGVISVLANIAPQYMHDMCADYLEGRIEDAVKKQLYSIELINALFSEVNPIPVKTALNLMGFDAGMLRLPLCEMEDKNLTTLKDALVNFGINIKK
ncbi:MAG: 4-hydroxy-tetrahydrodipicolinate synthase [Eubacteriales bacterium]|nr:4-hydroxy-tetrahydrodipicolinate synthase [Eubacteriales bacterium]